MRSTRREGRFPLGVIFTPAEATRQTPPVWEVKRLPTQRKGANVPTPVHATRLAVVGENDNSPIRSAA